MSVIRAGEIFDGEGFRAAELFMENKDNVLFELDSYIESLSAYRDAIAADDMDTLVKLLDEGKKRKEEVDG